jgi:AcrR family transcriptional regulator
MNSSQHIDFNLKKEPRQKRAVATVEAILEASAQILESEGYAALTTNVIAKRAGVSIGSVYEYFPGKEAIVAKIVDKLVTGATARLHEQLARDVDNDDYEHAMHLWLELLYTIFHDNRQLLRVLIFQVPFIYNLPNIALLRQELLGIVIEGAFKTRNHYRIAASKERLYLISTTAAGALLHLALNTPPGIDHKKVIEELSYRTAHWLLDDLHP